MIIFPDLHKVHNYGSPFAWRITESLAIIVSLLIIVPFKWAVDLSSQLPNFHPGHRGPLRPANSHFIPIALTLPPPRALTSIMATTTTITMARQERSPAPTMRLECPEVTSGLQLMITVQRPVAKAAKAWLTSPLSRPLMSRRTRRSTEPTMKRIREGAYTIDEIPSIKAPVQRNPSQFRISLATTWILWTVYLATRVSFILCSPTNEWSSWTAWATLIAETLLVAQEAFLASNLITPLFTNCRPQSRPRYHLVGRSAPSVDVCITCCGEPSDVILNTVSAAIAQDYPPERFRVFILDDGHSAALREAVQKQHFLSRSHGGPEILYRSRNVKPSTKSYFKAGNLQFGITEAKRTGDAEYFASLDADMIAEPDWLRSMLPHMILDSRVGLVNPPQVSKRRYSSITG